MPDSLEESLASCKFLLARDVLKVVATDGDTHLGGEVFDEQMMPHFMQVFQKKNSTDIYKDIFILNISIL